MFRQLILIYSIVALVLVGYVMVTNSGRWDLEDIAQAALILGYPFLVFFYALSTPPASDEPTYLNLFFERRRLEEQAKIDLLKSRER